MNNKEFASFMATIAAAAISLVSAYYILGFLIILLS